MTTEEAFDEMMREESEVRTPAAATRDSQQSQSVKQASCSRPSQTST